MHLTPNPWKHQITIVIDEADLSRVTDETLAVWWHVAQANPADGFASREPGELAEKIGREIIRRWLAGVRPELWQHQGRHYYWHELTTLSQRNNDDAFIPQAPAVPPATDESDTGGQAGPREEP